MNDDNDLNLTVRVNPRQVHIAVRNVIKNEMGVDRIEIDRIVRSEVDMALKEILEQARKRVGDAIDEFLKSGLGKWMDRVVDEKLRESAKGQISQKVREQFEDQVDKAIDVVFRDGLEMQIGWKKHRIKIKAIESEASKET